MKLVLRWRHVFLRFQRSLADYRTSLVITEMLNQFHDMNKAVLPLFIIVFASELLSKFLEYFFFIFLKFLWNFLMLFAWNLLLYSRKIKKKEKKLRKLRTIFLSILYYKSYFFFYYYKIILFIMNNYIDNIMNIVSLVIFNYFRITKWIFTILIYLLQY